MFYLIKWMSNCKVRLIQARDLALNSVAYSARDLTQSVTKARLTQETCWLIEAETLRKT